jgi:gliding motility-associated-like protein
VTIAPTETYSSYLWHDGSTAPSYTTGQEGWVRVEVTDGNGCPGRDSVYVTVYELPVVDLGPDTTICSDEGFLLDAGPGYASYLWSSGEISQRITVYNNGNQEVWVEVESEQGCVGGDTIFFEPCQGKYNIKPPSGITPNGDGVNDVWNIYDLRHFPQAVVEIFDQWGTLVWKSEPGYSIPWDGNTMEGRAVPVDSYHYIIHFNDGSNKRHVSYLTVIR